MRSSNFRLLLPALLSFCLPVVAQSAQPANRIVAPIDESTRVTLAGNVHPLAQARYDRGPASLAAPTGRIALVLQRNAAQQQALTQYLVDLQSPGSPNYHKWLTPAQYGARFGVSDSDLATVQNWLQAHGFKIEKVPQARNLIQFSGTFGQIQEAFHTSIHTFQVNGVSHFANAADPQIPAALAPVVAGVGPLNDFRPKPAVVQGPRSHYDPSTQRIEPDLTLKTQSGSLLLVVDPADAATIYDTPNKNLNVNYSGATTYDGTGVNIGVVGVSNLEMQDITNFRTAFLGESSTSVNLPTVVIDGNDPGVQAGGAVEGLLDNEVAGGLAPKAKITYYAAADTDLTSGLIDATLRAIDDNTVSIINMSFSACESGLGTSGNQLVDETAQQAAAQGISLVVSAGDNGSAGCDDFNTETAAKQGLAVNGFASTPYTIAVGGTDFDVLSTSMSTYVNTGTSGAAPYYETAKGPIPELPWNDSTTTNGALSANVATKNSSGNTNIVAGSGGVSSVYAKPSFQTSLTPADNARDLPDVSLFAADGFHSAFWALCSDNVSDGSTTTYTDCQNTNGTFTSSTTIGGAGGTSAAAPAFAGMLALIAQAKGSASDNYRLGQANYILYQIAKATPSAFHDVATGNNSVPCTSGSPNCGSNGFLSGYNAGTGYDTATGLGSVDLNALLSAWSGVSLGGTSTTLTINGSTAAYTGVHGANVTFNVGVTPTTATGSVAIIDTANTNSGGTLDNGQIAIALTSGAGSATYNGLPGGTYTVSARYGGDTSNAASTSSPGIPVTISAENSTTTLVVNAYDATTGSPLSSLTNIPAGDYVFLDAQVLGAAEGQNTQGTATGTVTFYNGSTVLGTGHLDSGNNLASYPAFNANFLFLPAGSYNITAKYSGDASYNASTSSAVSFTVVSTAAIALSNSGNITVTHGASGTSTITVKPSGASPGR
jgi:subtilase family serine protease